MLLVSYDHDYDNDFKENHIEPNGSFANLYKENDGVESKSLSSKLIRE